MATYHAVGKDRVAIRLSDTGLVMTFSTRGKYISFARKRSGYNHAWTQVGDILERANAQMAHELQQFVLEEMQRGLQRPAVSTGRLAQAIADPRNIKVQRYRFGVGIPRWLDRSQAKYWRQIDEGYAGHIGQPLIGIWGGTLTGQWRTSAGGNRYAVPGPAYTQHGEGTGGKFRPMGRTSQARSAATRMTGESRKSLAAMITQPITAEHYHRDAWRKFNGKERALKALREAVHQVLGTPTGQIPKTYAGVMGFL